MSPRRPGRNSAPEPSDEGRDEVGPNPPAGDAALNESHDARPTEGSAGDADDGTLAPLTAPRVAPLENRAHRPSQRPRGSQHDATILGALRAANAASGRLVDLAAVAAALQPKERAEIEASIRVPLEDYLSGHLRRLSHNGRAFSPGVVGNRRYWGHPEVLDPTTPLPSAPTGMDRILATVRRLSAEWNRGVSLPEVVDALAAEAGDGGAAPARGATPTHDGHGTAAGPAPRALSPLTVGQFIQRLVRAGLLRVVPIAAPLGVPGAVRHLYLPARAEATPRDLKGPGEYTSAVKAACGVVWQRHVREAEAEGRRPHPFTAAEVRAAIIEANPAAESIDDHAQLGTALLNLTRTRTPLLRRVSAPGTRPVLWAPASALEVDGPPRPTSARSDHERALEALRRALRHAGRPAVPSTAVAAEIERDLTLALEGSNCLAHVLSTLARHANPRRAARGTRTSAISRRRLARQSATTLVRAGWVGLRPFYALDDSPATRAYVAALRVVHDWADLALERRTVTATACPFPSLRVGRLRLIAAELGELLTRADRAAAEGGDAAVATLGAMRREATELGAALARRPELRDGANSRASTAGPAHRIDDVRRDEQILTTHDYCALTARMWPQAARANPSTLAGTIARAVRRVPNARYTGRKAATPIERALMGLEQGSALMHAAATWGGAICRASGSAARDALDRLRDARYVLPALDSADVESRLTAVACLGFLAWVNPRGEAGDVGPRDALRLQVLERLRTAAVGDPAPGVRRGALWAYGFAGAPDAPSLLREVLADRSAVVRTFAEAALRALALTPEGWWDV